MLNYEILTAPNYSFRINSSGNVAQSTGLLFDLSGHGIDNSGTKVVQFTNSYENNITYALLDLSRNYVNGFDLSGANLLRIAGTDVSGVGYIHNTSAVNAFTTDSSGNLWVGGVGMQVKTNYGADAYVTEAESMFVVPKTGTVAPTRFINVDVSGCNDIIKVNNTMIASVVDVSGVCRNFASSGSIVTIDSSIVLPRIASQTAAFSMTHAPRIGGVVIEEDSAMDLSGHRLVAFTRSGTTGTDVSGFYVVRTNTTNTGTDIASATDANPITAAGAAPGILFDLSLNKLGYNPDRNQLYVGANRGTNSNNALLIVPLDAPANVYHTDCDLSNNALFAYAPATSTTASSVDGSGFMIIAPNPTVAGTRQKLVLDSSGSVFDTLTLTDVSGINAMTNVQGTDSNGYLYNYLYLVDASRNSFNISGDNRKAKLAQIKLSARNANDGNYFDGSGVTFMHGLFSTSDSFAPIGISNISSDSTGNVFTCGRNILTIQKPGQTNNFISGEAATGSTNPVPGAGPIINDTLNSEASPTELTEDLLGGRPHGNTNDCLGQTLQGNITDLIKPRF
jgi:hypothetical protein